MENKKGQVLHWTSGRENFFVSQNNLNFKVVVSKRAALLLDRLMVALQKAVEDQEGAGGFAPDRSVRATAQQQSHQLPPSSSMNNDKSSVSQD